MTTTIPTLYARDRFVIDKASFRIADDGSREGETPNIACDCGTPEMAQVMARACNEHAALCAVADAAKRIQLHRAKLKDQSFKPNEIYFAKLTDLENELDAAIKTYEAK